jgi:hypothetical protein
VLSQQFAKEVEGLPVVMLAKAGIQSLKFLDSGSPPAFAGVGRNDGKLLSRILETP